MRGSIAMATPWVAFVKPSLLSSASCSASVAARSQVKIQAQHEIVAGLGRIGLTDGAHAAAVDVHFDRLPAGFASQRILEARLQPSQPHLLVLLVALILILGELIFWDMSHVADDV